MVILGPILIGITIAALGPLDQVGGGSTLRLILLIDLVYVMVVASLVLQRLAQMIAARRAKSAGSQLHLRLVGVFAFLALVPTVLVAFFAAGTLNFGLEGWFSDRVRNVVGASLNAAVAYKEEHRQELTRDGLGLAGYLNLERQRTPFMDNGEIRESLARVQGQIERSLTEAYVINGVGEILARGPRSYEFDFERPSAEQIEAALETGILIIEDADINEYRAIIPLETYVDRLLYVTREVDGEVLTLLDDTQESVTLYEQLENERGRLLFEFALLYLGFALILILAAIWLGFWFAERLSRPVGRLLNASQRVGSGDLNVRVLEDDGEDEISQLGRNFNEMTEQLRGQREELLQNNRQIERRRRLFDSVLSSITSGVVGLDAEGNIAFVNPSARRLLDVDSDSANTELSVAVPEFTPIFDRLRDEKREVLQDQVNLIRGGKQESLLVRVSQRRNDEERLEGYVVAFDDVTDLVSAQRMAAWGDVARRIAHEIKNPLTPIQLSAERIKRKFSPKVGEDSDVLEQMTEVIVRQTNDLRRIVDEFSKFARMPEPERFTNDVVSLVRDAVLLQEAGQPNVHLVSDLPASPILADLDSTMISQALTNLIKNAGEAIESLQEKGAPDGHSPEIRVRLVQNEDHVLITIMDNGIGLPEDRAKLFEPYVTTRSSGTGLGLPIVKKIIEEHGGTLSLTDADPFGETSHQGACALIDLPVKPANSVTESAAE
ncbi:ATP-binding protein [Aestuariibius sp. HNIBRBA575]|uniref:sensor histidine kinase NtrY-like n=1 Tax=Aestuariibius sp. HNIBRBA575 TaxID=3233343 RepID=UPI0034A14403